MEYVELELGIQLSDDDSSYTCPIVLHKDPTSIWKYYAIHNTGIHAVSVSLVWEIVEFLEKQNTANDLFNQASIVEYLLCTRTNATPILPVLGCSVINSTNVIVSLLLNGDVVSLPLKKSETIVTNGFLSEDIECDEETPLKKLLQDSFDVHIKNILKRQVNQPLINLDKNIVLSPQECLDLVSRTTNLLRQEYFTKFQLAKDEAEQRVKTLKALKALHLGEIKQLEAEKSSIKEMAERLAEKYEEIKGRLGISQVRC